MPFAGYSEHNNVLFCSFFQLNVSLGLSFYGKVVGKKDRSKYYNDNSSVRSVVIMNVSRVVDNNEVM